MTKILLCTLNSKYIHSSLALRYLFAACIRRFPATVIREFTINEPLSNIKADIYEEKPDILCFSCYIWNIQPTLQICLDIKKVAPETIIVLGGPEVSFASQELMQRYPCIDYILKGEGDFTLLELLDAIAINNGPVPISGLVYRENHEIRESPAPAIVADLNAIPWPYHDGDNLKDRLVYYETSRGCPFNCSYCLSSTIKGVRFLDLDRVKKELTLLINKEVKQIKFVDRTFNCREARAIEIMKFIIANPGKTRFHFELCADLISPAMLDFLATVPSGLFDFEIGIQSTCPEALEAVNRKADWNKITHNITRLKQFNNIHLHLDLIAGLPFEDYTRFGQSFNMVYQLGPDVLQLGFLKLLKGSSIREEADYHGYQFESMPPYQVLSNNYIDYGQIIKLTRIEDLLDKYYNSGDFSHTLNYVSRNLYNSNSFAFYEELADYWVNHGLFKVAHRKEKLYSVLNSFLAVHKNHMVALNELLKLDYLTNYKAYELPDGLTRCNPPDINDKLNQLLKNDQFLHKYLPLRNSRGFIRKNVVLEYFNINLSNLAVLNDPIPLLFVYKPGAKGAVRIIDDIYIYLLS
ncbi:MAG TPA: B12-binding domain-containing radical SAM protein [Syntrophomonas sp.]|mgnify:FL=1|nr:B12-binding domain-containing radical SAM protein [Syntrophomonas sp.]